MQSSEYEKYQKEIVLLQENSQILHQYITKYLTEIGCWNWEKVIVLLANHPSIEHLTYIASDYSANILELAENNISTQLPTLKMGNHQIMRSGNELFTNNLHDNTYLRLWCTIGNFYREEIINQLKNMNNEGTIRWNKIIFSYFNAPQNKEQIQDIIALYQNSDGKNFVLNGIKNLWLDPDMFEYIVEYSEEKDCLYVGIQSKIDYHIKLENGKEVYLKTWEKFYIHQSKRFSEEEIKDILKESWAKIEKQITNDGISIIVAQKNPKYYNKTIKIVGITWLLLLGALSGSIGYKISEYNQRKAQEEKNKSFLEKNLSTKYSRTAYFDARERNTTLGLTTRVDEASWNMYEAFIQIYGIWRADEKTVSLLENLMKQFFIRADTNGVLINIDKVYAPFLVDTKLHEVLKEFVAEYSQFLLDSWFDIVPYPQMQKYDDVCRYTQALSWEIQANYCVSSPTWEASLNIESDSTRYQKEFDIHVSDFRKKNLNTKILTEPHHTFSCKRYGRYIHTNWIIYDVLIVQSYDKKDFLLAYEYTYWEQDINLRQSHRYTKSNGEKVAKDFLENRYNKKESVE